MYPRKRKSSPPSKQSFLVSDGILSDTGGVLLIVLSIGFALSRFHAFPSGLHLGQTASLGAIFLVGLTAAFSTCLAVVGGLLLSVSAAWNESQQSSSRVLRFEPLFIFNIGRLAGYFLLGGIVGLIGKALVPSSTVNGLFTLIIAVVMILLGLRLLHILPKQYCSLPFPQSWQGNIRKLAASHNPLAPALIGALTFFVPCGFTQSMQLLALGSGSFMNGGIIMFTFALGTLPSLLGISFLSAFTTGRSARIFTRLSAAFVLLLGIVNLRSGFALMGIDVSESVRAALLPHRGSAVSENVQINNKGQQIISLSVSDAGFSPNAMTIAPGKETWIYANAPHGISGCASSIVAPAYGISTVVKIGENWLGPIQNPESDFLITCSTGVLKATIHVKQQPS